MDYETAIRDKSLIKDKVAIIGAGGIGFDIAEMLTSEIENNDSWYEKWGIDKNYQSRGGVYAGDTGDEGSCKSKRTVYLLQRKNEKLGKNLARTTGWVRRLSLRKAGVKMMSGVIYEKIDDYGLHFIQQGEKKILAVDHVIVCVGQRPENSLYQQLRSLGQTVYIIGGARKAAELDAESAIREGMELAYSF
jgi:2,4-dienoyl-CoA reductase (NADPH2)